LFLLACGFTSFLLVDSSSYPYLKVSSGFVNARTRSSLHRSSSSLPRVLVQFPINEHDGLMATMN